MNSTPPDLFKHLCVSKIIWVDGKISFNGFRIVSGIIPSSCLLKFLLWWCVRLRFRSLSSHNFFNQVGSMLSSNSQWLLVVSNIKIHLYSKLWFSCVNKGRLSFNVLSFFDESSCLVNEDTVSSLWLILTSDLKCWVVITNVFIHADCFACFTSFDKFWFSFFISFFVLKFKCMLQMNVSNFVLSMLVSEFKGFVELSSVGKIFNNCIN